MNFIYDLTPNNQFILENFEKLVPQDLFVSDINFFNFCNEYYHNAITNEELIELGVNTYDQITKQIKSEPEYSKLINYGNDFFNGIKLGEGSYGSVLKYGNDVLKINSNQEDYKFEKLYNVTSYKNISIYDPIYEGVSAIVFNDTIKKYSPSYFETRGVYITSTGEVRKNQDKYPWGLWFSENENLEDDLCEGHLVSILMEKLNTIPLKDLKKHIYYVLYIVLHNIYISQSKLQFVHGDLHIGNIVCKDYPKDENIDLVYDDAIITLKSVGWIPIIIDYGFSSFTFNGKRISSKTTAISPNGSSFDNYSDSVKLFGSILNFYSIKNMDFSEIEKCFLKNKNSINYLDKKKEVKYEIYENGDIKDIKDILSRLLDKIPHTVENIETDLKSPRNIISEIIKVNESMRINKFANYQNIKYHTEVIPNFTEAKYSNVLNIHLIEINETNQYKYVSECCKLNLVDFADENDGCIVINGTFFNMSNMGDFYKNIYEGPNYKNYDIEEYIQDYALIHFTNNKIKIEVSDFKDFELGEDYLLSGPLLVYQKKDLFTQDKIFETFKNRKKYRYKYTCTNKIREKKYEKCEGNICSLNCNNIDPGQLYHLGNPNPRTILATKGKVTYFIVIEGRTKEYTGASVEQMNDFLVNYLKVDYAINLDGGSSSCMMWSKNGKLYSPLNIYSKKTIGTVIALVKK